MIVTPTDVIAVGLEGGAPSEYVQGVGVFARQPAVAPHNLKWSAVGNIVTFSWSAPGIAPAGYVLEVGSQPGATNLLALPIGAGATSFTAAAPNGTFFVRVRAAGAVGAAAVPSNEVAAIMGCAAPPPPPTALSAELAGPVVTLRWNAPLFATPTGYVLEAGSASGAANIANVGLGPDATAFSAAAPPGTYFVRVRAANGCGQSVPSAEVFVTVGTGQDLPGAAGPLSATVSATFPPNVAVQWPAVPNAVGYVVEVGSAPRRANILTVRTAAPGLFAPNVPRGVYYLRVRAISAAGVGPPSPDHVVVVP